MTQPKLLNAQQIFNKVARHLLRQRRVSVTGVNCRLRDVRGRKCALGVLIPDRAYNPDLECAVESPSLANTCVAAALRAGGVSAKAHECLLEELRLVHDVHHPRSWKQELKVVAKRAGLNTRALCTP